ncbi:MAG: chromate transporter, partial [Oscillospiraceae bacterium]|nr:chromate transporter [Oscillospiraceae bacterium]
MKAYWDLFATFFRISIVCFGGGYSMIPLLFRELVDNKGWITEQELTDYVAVGQCTPGIIAVNVATFVGHKQKGTAGGILSTAGFITPCL